MTNNLTHVCAFGASESLAMLIAMGDHMEYLDVAPMIIALRATPEDFDMKGSWLRHFPSHNW
jgi:hypothetical protein